MPLSFRPKLDKIIELLLYLAHKRPGADKYQAVKFLYLADRIHFERYGRPITFEDYYALWYGPVASNALDLLNGRAWVFKRAGIKALPFETEIGPVKTKSGKIKETTYIRKPLREVDTEVFSKSDLKVFDEVIATYGKASFDELYDLTHEHFAYKNAWEKRRKGERAEMFYEEMIEDEELRADILEDIGPVAAHEMKLGEIFYWETDKAIGRKTRWKYHIFICGADGWDGHTFLLINKVGWGDDLEINKSDYAFLTYDTSYIGCNGVVAYTEEELKAFEKKPVGQLSAEHLKALFNILADPEVMEPKHANRLCNALKAAL